MPAIKRYKQLPLPLSSLARNVTPVCLSFRLKRQLVYGVLHGNVDNWTFVSNSSIFLRHIPSGRLDKYALWMDTVPVIITEIYNSIYNAALKAGYSLQEYEE
jgi:hypothetical protein